MIQFAYAVLLSAVSVPVVYSGLCEDTDPQACVLLSKGNPNLCRDAHLSETTCPRFCGLCPMTCFSCESPLLDPTNCTSVSSCSTGEVCSSRELKAADGRHEYTFGCLSKQFCDGIGLQIPFGKREVNTRDLSIACCSSDLCNVKAVPTTTSAPTTAVLSCKPDLIFMVDDGTAVGHSNFNKSLAFVSDIVKSLQVGDGDTKVAVVTYESRIHTVYNLTSPQRKQLIQHAINTAKYHGGSSYSEYALSNLRHSFLSHNSGDRSHNPDVLVMLAGKDHSQLWSIIGFLREQVQLLHQQGVRVVLVEVGSNTHVAPESHADVVIHASSYSTLQNQLSKVIQSICK